MSKKPDSSKASNPAEHKAMLIKRYKHQLESLRNMINNELGYMEIDGEDFTPSPSISSVMNQASEYNNDLSNFLYLIRLEIIKLN